MIDRSRKTPSHLRRADSRLAVARSGRGFTLVEMLVVIAIIVLAMTLAIPAIRSLTGSRSVEAAENAITSYIGQMRAEAIGQQKTQGVMFLLDTVTDRVMCMPVQDVTTAADNASDVAVCTFLDVIPDRDPYYLPHGIRVFMAKDTTVTYTDAFPNVRYLGPNFYPSVYPGPPTDDGATIYPIGVILFGADGKLVATPYGLRMQSGGARSTLAQLIYSGNPGAGGNPPDWPASGQHANHYLSSQIGFVLVDKESFLNGGSGFLDHDNPSANEPAIDTWIDTNTSAIIVNRYDGTLMRAE